MRTEARRAPRTFPLWVLQGLVGLDPLAAWAFAYQEPDRDAPGSRGEMNAFKTEPRPGLLSRLLAAYHDLTTARLEREVFADHRRELLRNVEGRVLEMSTGTGANFSCYPRDAHLELVAVEPDPGMLARAIRKAREVGAGGATSVEFHQSGAYPLPFDDASFNAAVYFHCLCTIPDPERALAEARRVLRPGGRFLFLEHVRSTDPKLASRQDRLHGPWKVFARGCNCNRDTRALIESSGLSIQSIDERLETRIPIPILRPMIMGVASKPAD